jgi:GWxTD domain-containing protein
MKTISIAATILILAAGVSLAEPPSTLKAWATGPASHLMTAAEKTAWKKVATEKEADEFIALFWAKRDPTAGTPANELRDEFETRVTLADEHFTTKRTRGAMTDRGRALIVLGPPFNVSSMGAQTRAARNPNISSVDNWDGSVIGPRGAAAKLVWTYAGDKKPKFIQRKEFELHFVDDQGDGEFALGKVAALDPEAVFLEAVNALVFAPELTSAPVYDLPATASLPTATFRTSSLREASDQFRSSGKRSEGPALLTWSEFVTPDGEIFVPVQLYLPAGSGIEAGRKLTFFGVVENEAGEIVSVHEDEVTLAESRGDAYVDKSLPLGPGNYKATFGLADGGRVLSIAAADMAIKPLDPNESAVSELILSNNTFALKEAQIITDPFAFGGLKVVPKGDGVFRTSDEIWYFYELRNPGLTDAGSPKVQAKITIEGKTDQAKPVRMSFPIQEYPAIPLKGVKNHYGLALAIPLQDFKPGTYSVKITVIDTVLQKSYESQKPFDVKL